MHFSYFFLDIQIGVGMGHVCEITENTFTQLENNLPARRPATAARPEPFGPGDAAEDRESPPLQKDANWFDLL
jgi:hypothetical protein